MDIYYYPYHNESDATLRAVWNKGYPITNFDPNSWRMDICGSVMRYSDHGQEGKYGWEIDHIYPRAKGGNDDLANLQPLYWRNNRRKGDTYPWVC